MGWDLEVLMTFPVIMDEEKKSAPAENYHEKSR